uniref:trypsin n=1 Tax=Acanthochromis polyacanthus TaxID=80966 RepID=A0A3Q1FP44_9TELE
CQYAHAVLVLTQYAAYEILAGRIIGGHEVVPYSVKYQASIQTETGQHYCGGTLVHAHWVVSAAHCWRPKNVKLSTKMRVVLGEHNMNEVEGYEQIFNVSRIYLHNYNYRTFDSDIMLIKLNRPAVVNAKVEPAQLPDQNDCPTRGMCRVSGWGVTQVYSYYLSPVLRAVDVQIIPHITPSTSLICRPQGDSGGPLICNGHFDGIVSWGISCANPFFPGLSKCVIFQGSLLRLKPTGWTVRQWPFLNGSPGTCRQVRGRH